MDCIAAVSHNPCIQVFTTKRLVKGKIVGSVWRGTICVRPHFVGFNAGVSMSMEGEQSFSAFGLKHLIDRLAEIYDVLCNDA